MDAYLENPYVLVGGAILVLAFIILLSQRNARINRARKNRSFRKRYYEKRKSDENLHQDRR